MQLFKFETYVPLFTPILYFAKYESPLILKSFQKQATELCNEEICKFLARFTLVNLPKSLS